MCAATQRHGLDLGTEKTPGPLHSAHQGNQLVAFETKKGNQRPADEAGGASDEYAHQESFPKTLREIPSDATGAGPRQSPGSDRRWPPGHRTAIRRAHVGAWAEHP